MNYVLIVNKNTTNIEAIQGSPDFLAQYGSNPDINTLFPTSEYAHLVVPLTIDIRDVSVVNMTVVDTKKSLYDEIRVERNRLLSLSDWTQLPDAPVQNKTQWSEYRQQLRDLPQTIQDPSNFIWPSAPN